MTILMLAVFWISKYPFKTFSEHCWSFQIKPFAVSCSSEKLTIWLFSIWILSFYIFVTIYTLQHNEYVLFKYTVNVYSSVVDITFCKMLNKAKTQLKLIVETMFVFFYYPFYSGYDYWTDICPSNLKY